MVNVKPTGRVSMNDKISYWVAVQYDDTTDVLDAMFYDIRDAMAFRDEVVESQKVEHWDGLQYVYVIADRRVMV
jgi:hypothetical protein